MDDFCVYVHTFPNGKRYVGMTVQAPEKRWGGNGSGYKGQPYVFNAILKYGWENIKHEVVFSHLSQNEAEEAERFLIKFYDSANKSHGYNVDLGGNHSGKFTEERKKQISKQQKGRKMSPETVELLRKRLTGHVVSEETRAKISAANKGRFHSEESKRKISEASLRRGEEYRKKLREMSLNRSPEVNQKISLSLTGKKQSKETIEKRAKKLRGIKHSQDAINHMKSAQGNRSPEWEDKRLRAVKATLSKPVQQISPDGTILNEYPSASDAARAINGRVEGICCVARGEGKKYHGYGWKYINERKEA